jgi:hypothetical protein
LDTEYDSNSPEFIKNSLKAEGQYPNNENSSLVNTDLKKSKLFSNEEFDSTIVTKHNNEEEYRTAGFGQTFDSHHYQSYQSNPVKPEDSNFFFTLEEVHRIENIDYKLSTNLFQNSKEKHIWYIIQKYLSKYLKNGMNIIGVIELEKITPDTGASFSFILISEIYIFSFEYKFKEEKLILLKKIKLVAINFISYCSDLNKINLHLNLKFENKDPICSFEISPLNKEETPIILANICKLCFENYSSIKKVVSYPLDPSLEEKIKDTREIKEFISIYNTNADKSVLKLNKEIPFDINECLIKLISLQKIDYKPEETKLNVILFITNKRLIEVKMKSNGEYKINTIRSFSKLSIASIHKKENKLELEFESYSNKIIYQSFMVNYLLNTIKGIQSKECLNILKINKYN